MKNEKHNEFCTVEGYLERIGYTVPWTIVIRHWLNYRRHI